MPACAPPHKSAPAPVPSPTQRAPEPAPPLARTQVREGLVPLIAKIKEKEAENSNDWIKASKQALNTEDGTPPISPPPRHTHTLTCPSVHRLAPPA
eukprot:364227-Chlamydomonas_euryale.AAC.3